MNKIYAVLLAIIVLLSWGSMFMSLWLLAFRRLEFGPGIAILAFSVVTGFFSIALMKDAATPR